jgi:hypothetical protein
MPLGEAKYINIMIPPLAFIIGDNQGGDQIASCTCGYGLWANHIPRTCDAIPAKYADVAKDSCLFLKMDDIKQLVLEEAWNEFEALYQTQCWNPLFLMTKVSWKRSESTLYFVIFLKLKMTF